MTRRPQTTPRPFPFPVIVAILALVATLSGCSLLSGGGGTAEHALNARVGDPAPDFTLTDADGRTVRLASYRGYPVVLLFWSSYGQHVPEAFNLVHALRGKFAPEGVGFVGLNAGDDTAEVRDWVREMNIGFPQLLADDELFEAYGIVGVPTLVVVDRQGNVVHREPGLDSGHVGRVRAAVQDAMDSPTGAVPGR